MTRHQHSTIRTDICNRPNTQVRGPYSRYRISPFLGVFQKPRQGHPGLVVCQASGGDCFPFFSFCHQIPHPNQQFSCYGNNSFFPAGPFTNSVEDPSGFFIFSDRYPCRINESLTDKDGSFFGDFAITDGRVRGEDAGTKPGIGSQFIRMVEPGEIAYLANKGSTDNIADTRDRGKNFVQLLKSFHLKKRLYFLFNLFNLSFIIEEVLGYLHKEIPVKNGELISEADEEQFQRLTVKDSGTGDIILQKDSVCAVDKRSMLPDKIVSVPGNLSKCSKCFVRNC